MSVARQILFFILQISFCAVCISQREKIENLRKILPLLHDSARIDCLNGLSEAFMLQKGDGYIPFNLTIIQRDSARLYAQMAHSESGKINYTKGESKAYMSLGRIEGSSYDDYTATDYYFTRALQLSLQIDDDNQLARAYGYLAWVKWIEGRFAEAMGYFEKAVLLFGEIKDTTCLSETYFFMSKAEQESGNYANALTCALKYQDISRVEPYGLLRGLYESVGDYETALYYAQNDPKKSEDKVAGIGIGNLFYLMKQYDSSMHYFELAAKNSEGRAETYFGKLYSRWGALYTAMKQYDTALIYLENALKIQIKANDGNEIMRVLLVLSSTCKEKGNIKMAMHYASELLQFANQAGGRQYIRDGNLVLFEIYERLQIRDSAYYHLRRYILIKDSIELDLSVHKLAFYKTKSEREQALLRINLLNKERLVQQQQLRQTAQQGKLLAIIIAAIILIGIVVIRNILLKKSNEAHRRKLAEDELKFQKFESERKQAEFKHQSTELEMQALRSQMNPHFIFNCLSSINRFILKNKSETASDYLTKFSRLVRLILQNSQVAFIPLESELESLQLYLELEALRFNHRFDYKIIIADNLDISVIKVPPLIIQPYAENAIWHGLMQKEGKGNLSIAIEQGNYHLIFKIADDGIGRKAATELASKSGTKHKSVGLKITAERIALLQNLNGTESPVTINDLVNADGSAAGTEVTIKIPAIH